MEKDTQAVWEPVCAFGKSLVCITGKTNPECAYSKKLVQTLGFWFLSANWDHVSVTGQPGLLRSI